MLKLNKFIYLGLIHKSVIALTLLCSSFLFSPNEYAEIALVFVIVNLAMVLGDFGISTSIIRLRRVSPAIFMNAIYVTFAFFVCITFISLVIIYLDIFVWLFKIEMSRHYIYILGILSTKVFSSTLKSLLMQEKQYNFVAKVEVLAVIIALGIFCIPIYLGDVEIEYVTRFIFHESFITFLLTLYACRSKFSLAKLDKRVVGYIFNFGLPLFFSRLIDQIGSSLDLAIIGSKFNSLQMGNYFLAQKYSEFFTNVLISKLQQHSYTYFKKRQQSDHDTYFWYIRFSSLVGLLYFTIFKLFFIEAVQMFYDDNWQNSFYAMEILALYYLVQSFGSGVTPSFILANGYTQLVVYQSLFKLFVLPIMIYIALPAGVVGICWALVLFGILGRLFNQMLTSLYTGLSLLRYLRILVPSLILASIIHFIS